MNKEQIMKVLDKIEHVTWLWREEEQIADEILALDDIGWAKKEKCPYCGEPIEIIKQCSIRCLDGF